MAPSIQKPNEHAASEEGGVFSWFKSFLPSTIFSAASEEKPPEQTLAKKGVKHDAMQRKQDVIEGLWDDKEVRKQQVEAVQKKQQAEMFNQHEFKPDQKERKMFDQRMMHQSPRHV